MVCRPDDAGRALSGRWAGAAPGTWSASAARRISMRGPAGGERQPIYASLVARVSVPGRVGRVCRGASRSLLRLEHLPHPSLVHREQLPPELRLRRDPLGVLEGAGVVAALAV